VEPGVLQVSMAVLVQVAPASHENWTFAAFSACSTVSEQSLDRSHRMPQLVASLQKSCVLRMEEAEPASMK
jgi:hypothetical protein